MQDSKLGALLGYLARGWALVPLHDVSAGACSCREGPACKSAGKHPRYRAWQEAGQLVRDGGTLAALHGAHPGWNWGVATGTGSRLWVLDYDPAHADAASRALVERLYLAGLLPHVRTGGGGEHWYFALSEGMVVRNFQASKRLGAGLDARGEGGQVVAPPSVSGKGAYTVGVEPFVAYVTPAWLAEMATAREPAREAPATPAGSRLPASDGGMTGAAVGLAAGVAGARGEAYARATMAGLVSELVATPEGDRNNMAYRVACRVHELVNAGWLLAEVAWSAYVDAGRQVGLDDRELASVWSGAERRMAGNVAVLPPGWGGDVVPFGPAPTAGASPAGQLVGAPGAAEPVGAFEAAVGAEMARLQVRAEATRRLAELAAGDQGSRVEALWSSLVDSAGLDSLPVLAPLVRGLLYRDTAARVVGPSGHGKSFVMLDIAGSVATGAPWAGRTTVRGDVLYLVAEGAGGMRDRVRAWEALHGRAMTGVRFLPLPVQAADPHAWDAFVEVARKVAPALVVLDTQARVTVGVDENSATEMGVFVDAVERLRRATGACVVLVHHKGHSGDHGRGSSAVRAALQTELDVTRRGTTVTVTNTKQKDGEEAPGAVFALRKVGIDPDQLGPSREGAALEWQPEADVRGYLVADEVLTGHVGEVALVCREVAAGAAGVTKAELRVVVMTERRMLPHKATYYRVWSQLLERRVLGRIHGTQSYRYIPPEDRAGLMEPVQDGQGGDMGFYAP